MTEQKIPKADIPQTREIRQVCIANVIAQLHTLDDDKAYTVKISRDRQKRTIDQNSKFHAMCQELGDTLGYTCEELKRLVKHELGFYKVIQGQVGKVARLESSAEWDAEKMSRAIEQLNLWAIEVSHLWRVET